MIGFGKDTVASVETKAPLLKGTGIDDALLPSKIGEIYRELGLLGVEDLLEKWQPNARGTEIVSAGKPLSGRMVTDGGEESLQFDVQGRIRQSRQGGIEFAVRATDNDVAKNVAALGSVLSLLPSGLATRVGSDITPSYSEISIRLSSKEDLTALVTATSTLDTIGEIQKSVGVTYLKNRVIANISSFENNPSTGRLPALPFVATERAEIAVDRMVAAINGLEGQDRLTELNKILSGLKDQSLVIPPERKAAAQKQYDTFLAALEADDDSKVSEILAGQRSRVDEIARRMEIKISEAD